MKNKVLNRVLKITTIVVLSLILVFTGYVSYVMLTYSRIHDKQSLTVNGKGNGVAINYTEYTIVTQNIGFGAYTPDFTFFMDGGSKSRANSKSSVLNCIETAYDKLSSYDPDFVFLQEVDTNSDRSYHVNQKEFFENKFLGYTSVYGVNYHSAYLFYPIFKPHGKSNSGIATFSKFDIYKSERRSLPVSAGLSKFLDLDRCYTVTRVFCSNGKQLVLFNVHTSAYGGSDEIRTAQMTMLFNEMQAEYDAGNRVICGGDFNHDFTGSSTQDLNDGNDTEFGWAQPLPTELLSDDFKICTNYTGKLTPTCRNCDVPYSENCFTAIVDGFIVSQNITVVSVENVDAQFEYSDHNPVVMKFKIY